MGKTEKLVVLSILFLVVVLFVWSLGGGGQASEASERPPTYGADAGDKNTFLGSGGDARKLVSSLEAEKPFEGGRVVPKARPEDGADAVELEERPEAEILADDQAPAVEPDPSAPHARALERPKSVMMMPDWDLVTTVGLERTIDPDMLLYRPEPGATWKSLARDLYGKESKLALLRHNNEGMEEPGEMIFVPAKDNLGALGESLIVEVQRGETLWGVATRSLGSGQRWREIYEANRDVVPDPDYLAPGTVLTIPAR